MNGILSSKKLALLAYVITGLMVLTMGITEGNFNKTNIIGVGIYFVLSFGVILILGLNKRLNIGVYTLVYQFFYLFLGAGFIFALERRDVYVTVAFTALFLGMAISAKSYLVYSFIMCVTFLSTFTICPLPIIRQEPDYMIFTCSVCSILVAFVMGFNHLSDSQRKDKKMENAEELEKQLELKSEEAKRALESKTLFLSNISHEIRTPLTGILGMNEMIGREVIDDNVREYTMSIEQSGKRLLAVLNDIIDYSRLENEELQIVNEETYLNTFINDVLIVAKPKILEKQLKLNLVIDEDIPECVSMDKVQMRRILTNLLMNSAGYTDEGMVTFKASYEKTESPDIVTLVFEVIDTGCGIKKEDMHRLFKPFGRVDEKEHYQQGTGMGLAIAKSIIDMMGGEIKVDSEYGKGSRFVVKISTKVVSPEGIGVFEIGDLTNNSNSAVIENVGVFDGIRVLAVDDVPVNLKVFKGLLKNTGAVVDVAGSGAECLDMAKNHEYNIIFLDHMMPDMDGIETFAELKKLPGFEEKNIPVIVFTANAMTGARKEYLNEGFLDYMSKPIRKDRLMEMINKYVLNGDNPNFMSDNSEKAVPVSLQFAFLDVDEGVENCGGDEELLIEVIAEYLASERSNEFDSFFKKENWKDYEILVHALKSTSKAIGAIPFSEKAKALELAAKRDDIDYIKANHPAALAEYMDLLAKIKSALSGNEVSTGYMVESIDTRYCIYVVDDDRTNLKMASGILRKHFQVETFESGTALLKRLEEKIPGLILLDIKMPEMTGFEVVETLSANDAWKEIPVIFLTAADDSDTEVKGFKCGAMDFIRKPFVASIMLERINRIIELTQLRRYLESEVDRKSGKVEKLSLQAMETLAMTIDAKDKYTNGHSTRVATYSRELAERLGYSDEEQQSIYYMGLLHDIGKIGVPDTIINKTGKLTDDEFAMIKKHPEIGHSILKNITEIPDIEKGARWHHERYDGKGYPDGLKGEEIPLFARIIAVADSYDAMTSKRSYRDVLAQDFVRGELDKGRGTQFDSKVVDVMLQMIDEDKTYSMKEQ